MKKLMALVLVFACVLGMAGCKPAKSASGVSESTAPEMQESQQAAETQKQEEQSPAPKENGQAAIAPLPPAIDITKLENCRVAVSLEKGDVYTDETGAVMMDVTVFVYDLYDMVDIAGMKEGDTILRGREEVLISSIERRESGLILINGGLEEGGFELYTEENTVYYERGYSNVKSYYELGKVSLPLSPGFVYRDASDLDKEPVCYRAEDLLNNEEVMGHYFSAHNTTLQIEDGYVTEMTRVYIP